jgi:protein SCO1/2
MSQFRPNFLLLFVAIISVTLGSYMWKTLQPEPTVSDSSVFAEYPEPRILADFALSGPGDSNWSLEQLHGHWTLVFFGYTSCPDVCPATLMQLAELRKSLAKPLAQSALPQVLFISVDPGRDTPERIEDYVTYFDPAFTGITGPDAQIAALSMQMGVAYFIGEHSGDGEIYDVAHSTGILLLDPKARLVGLFPAPHDIRLMQAELVRRIDGGSG